MKKIFSFDLFEKALFRNNLTANSFAELAKIPRMTVYAWKTVKQIKKPTYKEAIERILHVKYEDLCTYPGISGETELVEPKKNKDTHDHKAEWPIIGNSRGGEWLETIENGYPGISDEWAEAPSGVMDENGYALRMLGDSMIPEFPPGSVVFVSPNGEVLSGSYAVVIIESRLDDRRESCVKKVSIGKDVVTLHSLNPKYPDIQIPRSQIIAMHKIVECRVMTIKRYE